MSSIYGSPGMFLMFSGLQFQSDHVSIILNLREKLALPKVIRVRSMPSIRPSCIERLKHNLISKLLRVFSTQACVWNLSCQ